MKIDVAIIASGNGTRMQSITGGYYPKILASVGDSVLLERMVENIRDITRNLFIVAKEADLEKIREWIVTNMEVDFPIYYVIHDRADGSNSAIHALQVYMENFVPKADDSHILIQWSDITSRDISYALGCMRWDADNIGIICKDRAGCRFEMQDDGRIISSLNGNVVGMYLVNNFRSMFLHPEKAIDFINEVVDYHWNHLIKIDISDLTDIGDEVKYSKTLNEYDNSTRYFNDIFIDEVKGTVVKTATCPRGVSVMAAEMNWYDKIKSDYVPRILSCRKSCDSASIEMQYVEGLTVQDYFDRTSSDIIWLAVREAFDSIHMQGETQTTPINEDILHEYVHTIYSRVNEVKAILPSPFAMFKMDEDVTVCGAEFEEVVRNFEKYLRKQLFDICPIHGDPNSCNMLIDHHQKVWLIDPRGRFGHSIGIYGDISYDIAKFIYGISGYSKFNLMKDFRLSYDTLLIWTREIDANIYNAMEKFGVVQKWHIRALIGMIWLKLTGYIKNQPNKAIFAFYFGLYLLKTSLNELKNE